MDPMRVAVIGRTGRGDYGHAIDELWVDIPGTKLVAVADDDAAGLAKAVGRLGLDAAAGHRDWRAML